MASTTEKLRRLLDERGAHWWEGEDERKTLWESNGLTWEYFNDENGDAWLGFLGVCESDVSPEQAIAATLGSGTSNSEAANPQVRCTDSKRNAPVRDREDSHTLLPCPFCGGAPARQHFNVSAHLPGRIICSCGAEMRQGRNQTSAELVGAWNARTCGEEGAIIATEENMAEHGWVRERTCHIVRETKTIRSFIHGNVEVTDEKCSECGGFMDVCCGVIRNYCPNCGAKVVEP